MAVALTCIRWVLGGAALALGGYIIVLQCCMPLWQLWARRASRPVKNYSFVPLMGPLLFQAGAWVLPFHGLRPYAWVGWLLDPGTWVLLLSLPFLIGEYRQHKAGGGKP